MSPPLNETLDTIGPYRDYKPKKVNLSNERLLDNSLDIYIGPEGLFKTIFSHGLVLHYRTTLDFYEVRNDELFYMWLYLQFYSVFKVTAHILRVSYI